MKSTIVCLAIIAISLTFTVHTDAEIDLGTARGIWLLDEGDGNMINDMSGNENHGELQGGEWVDGPDGPALSLNGQDDRVIIADSESLYLGEGVDDHCMDFREWHRERLRTYSRQKTRIWSDSKLRLQDKLHRHRMGSILFARRLERGLESRSRQER